MYTLESVGCVPQFPLMRAKRIRLAKQCWTLNRTITMSINGKIVDIEELLQTSVGRPMKLNSLF